MAGFPDLQPAMKVPHREGLAFTLLLALLGVAAGAAFGAFAWPSQERWISIGSVGDFPPGSVTPFGDGVRPVAFYVVRLAEGELLALAPRLVHPNPACVAEYRPSFVFRERSGWFFEPCRNEVFDMAGVQVLRRWPRDLDRLAVEVRDGFIFVGPSSVTQGARQPQEGYEFRSGGVLLPARRY